jgi:8-oxo-dGTP pyrophosphatase MutT (NUDIX family)
MNVFNEAEFYNICKKLDCEGTIKDVTVRYTTPSYFNRIRNVVQRDRRGEVVFCVIRPDGRIITTACRDYPENIYRIPTGGIGHGEDILDAIFREVREELGLEVRIRSFAGAVRIRFEYKDSFVMFYSYIFILDEIGGKLLVDASDDEISAIKEVDLEGLECVAAALDSIKGKWHDWGKFRYITTHAALRYLRYMRI